MKKGSRSCLGQDAEEVVSEAGEEVSFFFPLPPDSLLYPEAYQPPPLSTNDVLEISLWDVPPQTGQIFSLS
jgi:protein involved in polysaccharide export with SLBB domain